MPRLCLLFPLLLSVSFQTQYLTPPKSPSPINLPVHYTPAISASPLRQVDRLVAARCCFHPHTYVVCDCWQLQRVCCCSYVLSRKTQMHFSQLCHGFMVWEEPVFSCLHSVCDQPHQAFKAAIRFYCWRLCFVKTRQESCLLDERCSCFN